MSEQVPTSQGLVEATIHEQVMAGAQELIARGVCSKRDARDPVSQPTINSWLDAMGDPNPRWRSGEAPPAMAQVWTMYALGEERDPDDPLHTMMGVLTDAGFSGVLGTNCEQTYERTMRVGELPRREIRLESVVGPKQTGMGIGYFVTSRTEWFVGEELVASMLFRVLKYIPRERAKPDRFVLYPTRNRDTEFFWEGTAVGELRIQKCNACGVLRHPPGPSCPACHAFDSGYVVAQGSGTVFSHVTHHHPKIPGHALPLQVALVDLDEGVRMVAGAAEPLEIGQRVHVDFRRIDDDLTLPVWRLEAEAPDTRPASSPTLPTAPTPPSPAGDLGEWSIQITPTFVVSTAIATRDFQDVHHDKARAIELGSKDIFVNILTSQGLVQRYVTDALGYDAEIRSIDIRLGAPAHPGDTLVLSGGIEEEVDGMATLNVRGDVFSSGSTQGMPHITGTVVVQR